MWIYLSLVLAGLLGAYSLPCMLSVMTSWASHDYEAPFCLRAVSSFIVSAISLGWLYLQYTPFEIREALGDLKEGNHLTGGLFYASLVMLGAHAVTLVATPVLVPLHVLGARKYQTA